MSQINRQRPVLESAYLCVEDMERAIDFYDWFLQRSGQYRGKSLYMYDIQGFRLFLFDHQQEGEAAVYGDNCLLSFEIENIEELKEEVEGYGLEIVFPLTEIGDNILFEFADTEGNHLEVFARQKRDEQL